MAAKPPSPSSAPAKRRTRAKKPAASGEAITPDEVIPAEGGGEGEPEPAAEAAEPTDAEIIAEETGAAPSSPRVPVPRTRALAPSRGSARDVLQMYMNEVQRHPILTREEEHELALKFRDTGDVKAAYRLVASNLRLVVKIAYEYRRSAFNVLDLIQEGNVGLMHAVQKFDPTRGVKLSSYAAWWIRAYILRYVMDNWRMVKLGTTQAQRTLFFNLRKEQERLASQGYEPGPKLLAERLQVSEQDVVDMDRRLSQDEFSLDAPLSDDSKESHQDRLSQGGQAVDERLGDEELSALFRRELAEFSKTITDEKERFIFEKRLTADEPLKLQEIGDHYKLTRERVRQIEAKLTARLKSYLKERIPDFKELSLEREDS